MLSKKNKRQQFEQPIVGRIFKILQAVFPAVVASCCLEFGVQEKKDSCLHWFYRQSHRQDLALSRIPDVVWPVSLFLVFCQIVGKNLDVDLASMRTFCVPHHWISRDNNDFPTQIKVKYHIYCDIWALCYTANMIVPATSSNLFHEATILHLHDTMFCSGKLARRIPNIPPNSQILMPQSAGCGQL